MDIKLSYTFYLKHRQTHHYAIDENTAPSYILISSQQCNATVQNGPLSLDIIAGWSHFDFDFDFVCAITIRHEETPVAKKQRKRCCFVDQYACWVIDSFHNITTVMSAW